MPIPGTVWATDCWDADAWAANTWADSGSDVTAPVLSNPTRTEVSDLRWDGGVDTDEGNGTLYWIISETVATFPSVAQMKAGQDSTGSAAADSGNQTVSASGTQSVAANGGLTEDTIHYYFFLHTDTAGNDSNIVRATSFTTDVVTPVVQSPTGTATSATSGRGTVSTNEADGTLYWIIDQSATAPSVAQIQAGNDNGGSAADASGSSAVTVTGTQTVNGGGLVAETTYYFHFQQQDSEGNDSTVVSSTSFTTPAASGDDFELRLRDGTYRRRFGFGV